MKRKQIRLSRENIRLSIVHQVYKEKVKYTKMPDGELIPEKQEILKKEITVQKWFRRDAIVSVEEYATSQNKIAKNRSIVTDKYTGRSYATFHSPEEVMNTVYQEHHVTGFKN